MELNGQALETAILRTVIYADVFSFPMTLREIHHFLISDVPVTIGRIESTLQQSSRLQQALINRDNYYALGGRDDIITLRLEREIISVRLWAQAVRYGHWLARLPFVRMVALTGALAMRNPAHVDDDLDYLIVTQSRRVWIARAFTILLVKLVARRGVTICPNYVLAINNLEQNREDLFIAHEITQMVPLYGSSICQQVYHANEWVEHYLPNACSPFHAESEYTPTRIWSVLKVLMEWVLRGPLGDWIEQWERRRKLDRFADAMQTLHSSALLDETQVKGHFNDHGHPILKRYFELLRRYDLDYEREVISGD